MDTVNRLKKEMTEGIVRALLEDAGYRVIDSGIEKVLRELTCLTAEEYIHLQFPTAMRQLPDFVVMDRNQSIKFLVEVKYRKNWENCILTEIQDQVMKYKEMVLVVVNANPEDLPGKASTGPSPSSYLRCCRLRLRDECYELETNYKKWILIEKLESDPNVWWKLSPLQNVFELLKKTDRKTTTPAMQALEGILER